MSDPLLNCSTAAQEAGQWSAPGALRDRPDGVGRLSDRNGILHALSPAEHDAVWTLVRAMRGEGADEDLEPEDVASRIKRDLFNVLDDQGRAALLRVTRALVVTTMERCGREVRA